MSDAARHRLTEGEDDFRLLSHVRPPGWTNPRPAPLYDLLVVGGGTAGLVSAFIARALGARVAIVERGMLGGDCLVTGCVPSKALLASARAAAAGGSVTLEEALARLRRLRADIAENDAAARLTAAGIDVFFGSARFTGPAAADVGGACLAFRRCILAMGARAAVPPIEGLRDAGYLTNETVFSLETPPRSLLVLGGGPIGCELSQAFARLGVRVTLVHRGERLLPRDDEDAAALVARALLRDGVDVKLRTQVVRAEAAGSGRRVLVRCAAGTEETLSVDAILVATGRRANTDDLGLEAAGVAVRRDGFLQCDDALRTTNRRILAAGDVAGLWQFTHAADAMARVAVQNALLPLRRKVSSLVIPWCTYTDPEVAHVGISASEAATRPGAASFTVPLAAVDRAVLDGTTEGFARLHVQARSGRILGATLVAPHAGESIAEIALAMRSGISAAGLEDTVHCYPTQAEALRRAAAAWRRTRLRPWMPELLKRWYALLR